MPQIGSTVVGGPAPIKGAWRARSRLGGGDALLGDLLRPLGADVETRGRAQSPQLLLGHAVGPQRLHDGGAAPPARDEADVRDPLRQRPLQRRLLVAPVRRHNDRGVAGLA